MGKEKRKLRNGTGPYSGGIGRRERQGGICPFDIENKEDITNMEFDIDRGRRIKVADDKIGKGSRLKPSTFL